MGEVGGLEGAAEDGDGVVLGCDVVEGFGAAGMVLGGCTAYAAGGIGVCSYYFSTHGCKRVFSGCEGADLEELAAAAASFCRALMSKKLAMSSPSSLEECHVSGMCES